MLIENVILIYYNVMAVIHIMDLTVIIMSNKLYKLYK